jgi:ABC-type iron transport system FetAB ATPase subunit
MGALMACSIISNRALSPIAQISGKIVQWQHAKVALKGLDSIMKLPTDRNENTQMIIPEVCEGRIRAAGLSFAYYEESLAINNVNLNIKPGERIAIIGPVGSGKSTLIKTISGLYRPSKGQVFLDEVDMAHIDPEFLRESIGYLTQDVRLFNGTLRYNLTIGLPSPRDAQILDACKKTGLIEIIKNHDKGLELPIYEGGKGLSGGQRQLVGLTRVLIAKPKIKKGVNLLVNLNIHNSSVKDCLITSFIASFMTAIHLHIAIKYFSKQTLYELCFTELNKIDNFSYYSGHVYFQMFLPVNSIGIQAGNEFRQLKVGSDDSILLCDSFSSYPPITISTVNYWNKRKVEFRLGLALILKRYRKVITNEEITNLSRDFKTFLKYFENNLETIFELVE